MKTTRQQQDATRRQIVASAVDLMTRQGFDGTTMKDIARAAGIGRAYRVDSDNPASDAPGPSRPDGHFASLLDCTQQLFPDPAPRTHKP